MFWWIVWFLITALLFGFGFAINSLFWVAFIFFIIWLIVGFSTKDHRLGYRFKKKK